MIGSQFASSTISDLGKISLSISCLKRRGLKPKLKIISYGSITRKQYPKEKRP
jgi:hypothetical protein